MRIGYEYAGGVWLSESDCEEIALSLHQERIYNYALRCFAYGSPDWKRRVDEYERRLVVTAFLERRWKEVVIMD